MNNALNIPQELLLDFFGSIPTQIKPFGGGHINSTFLIVHNDKKYILQRINTKVFIRPHEVMDNIIGVTEHIQRKVEESDKKTCSTIRFLSFSDGKSFFDIPDGDCWRIYEYIDNTTVYDKVKSPDDFYNCAIAFGHFQQHLSDYPAHTLYETIPDFHNTPKRYENLMASIEKDAMGRAFGVSKEIAFARQHKDFCNILEDAYKSGELPLRVTHNDTKLNNVLFDEITDKPSYVIDLDTVMPGYAVTDFGDAIRYGANTAAEDEVDLSKVSLDLELFGAFAKGFIDGCNGSLTQKEIELLPIGAIMMTLECGMRFLTDYIDGDVYFKIHRQNHNLDRCRCQFALVADMERKLSQMNDIVASLTK